MKQPVNNPSLKCLTPDNLYDQIHKFTSGMAVTRDKFELVIPQCTVEDIEWNHMDQMHRLSIHNTYEKAIRIACGPDFAISLTQWKNWPFFITVSDVYVAKGLFYQSLTIAGFIFLHSIISMETIPGTNDIKLVDEWFIASHKLFRFIHKPLNKKLYTLNVRLQEEDEQIRQGRFVLRQKGYRFKTDSPNYYTSNRLTTNTIYPTLNDYTALSITKFELEPSTQLIGGVEFIIKKDALNNYYLWPAACPHEGGPLFQGKICDVQITCPWHGLRFSAAILSPDKPTASRYGFEYHLVGNDIQVKQSAVSTCSQQETVIEHETIEH